MRSTSLLVLALMLMSSLAAGLPSDDGPSRGPGPTEDRSPQIFIVDASGGSAFTTIQGAVDAASPDDIIRVYEGTYNETIVVDKTLTLIGNGSSISTIDGRLTGTVVTIAANNVSLDGFMIRMSGTLSAGIDLRGTHNTTISNCFIGANGFGIRGDQGVWRTNISSCYLPLNTNIGIWLEGEDNLVADCIVIGSDTGVSINGRDNYLTNNNVTNNDVGFALGSIPDRVLMMGNSYTQANSLDDILQRLLANTIPDPDARRLTSGGLRLSDHASRALTPGHSWNTTLNRGANWDTVILQDQSQIPGFPTTHGTWQASLAGARVLDAMTEEVGADTVLMMTWGRRDGDPTNPGLYPNFTVMQDHLEEGYLAYAENLTSRGRRVYVAPVGLAFRNIHDEIVDGGGDPTTPGSLFHSLYASDGSHPSLAGSYLAACVLYATLTGNSPVGLKDSTPLSAPLKLQLQEAVVATFQVEARDYDIPPYAITVGSTIMGNNVTDNDLGLIMGYRSIYNDVQSNIFEGNTGPAVLVLENSSLNNRFVQNAFKDNNGSGWQVEDRDGDNLWDAFWVGNWWSDYEDRYPNATIINGLNARHWDTPYHDLDDFPLASHRAFPDAGEPVADAGPDIVVDEDTVVHFDGSRSTDDRGISSWTWTFLYENETVTLNGMAPAFTFAIPGVYHVKLVVRDAGSRGDFDTVNVTVRDVTDPVAIAIWNASDEDPTMVFLDARSSADNVGIINWTWSFVDQGTKVTLYGDVVEHNFTHPGSYLIELRVIDDAGNEGFDSIYITFSDTEDPVAEAGPDQEVDMGSLVTFNGSASTDNFGIDGYSWAFTDSGATVLLPGIAPEHYFSEAGVYSVNLRVTDLEGNTHDDIMTVSVRDTEPPVAVAADGITVDMGGTITLDGSASTDNVGLVGWTWSFVYGGTPVASDAESFPYTFEQAGVIDVTLTVRDAAGNADTHDLTINVRDTERPVADGGSDRAVDMDTAVTLDASSSTDNVAIVTYSWSITGPGTRTSLNGIVIFHVFERAGVYEVLLTVTDGAANSATDGFTITVRDTEPPTVDALPDINTTVGREETFTTYTYDNVDVVKWTWSYRLDGRTVTLDGPRVDHAFTEAGTYTVTLTVEDAAGNVASTSFIVRVEASISGTSTSIIAIVVLAVVAFVALIIILDRQRSSRV